jgi:group I intron endonuclease
MTGIYIITNTKTNKSYIGKSTDIERRWKKHISALNLNKHINLDLQSDWIKYGQDSFSFKVLEVCSKDILTNRENHWIDIFNARAYGYNYDPRKNTKSKWCNKSKESVLMEELLEMCSYYTKSNVVSVFNLDDICSYLNINHNKKFEIQKILNKMGKEDYQKHNAFIQYDIYNGKECLVSCKWNEELYDDVRFEEFDVDIINSYKLKNEKKSA